MPDTAVYFSVQEKLIKYIEVLFGSFNLCTKDQEKKQLREIIIENLFFLKFLVSKTNKLEKEYLTLMDKCKLILTDKKELENNIENFEFKNKSELLDRLNYIKVVVKNLLNIDLDEVKLEEIEKKVVIDKIDNKYPKYTKSFLVYKNFLGEDFSKKDNETPNDYVENLLLKSHAVERLNKDIADGIIYIYRTKPKRNINIKYFIMFLMSLGIFISLVLFCGSIVSFATQGDSGSQLSKMSVTSFISFFCFIYAFLSFKKTFSNDNFKYSFQKKNFYHIFLFTSFFSLVNFLKPESLAGVVSSESGSNTSLSTVLFALFVFLFLIIFVIFALYSFSYFYLNPEKDMELIADRIAKHMDSLSGKTT